MDDRHRRSGVRRFDGDQRRPVVVCGPFGLRGIDCRVRPDQLGGQIHGVGDRRVGLDPVHAERGPGVSGLGHVGDAAAGVGAAHGTAVDRSGSGGCRCRGLSAAGSVRGRIRGTGQDCRRDDDHNHGQARRDGDQALSTAPRGTESCRAGQGLWVEPGCVVPDLLEQVVDLSRRHGVTPFVGSSSSGAICRSRARAWWLCDFTVPTEQPSVAAVSASVLSS